MFAPTVGQYFLDLYAIVETAVGFIPIELQGHAGFQRHYDQFQALPVEQPVEAVKIVPYIEFVLIPDFRIRVVPAPEHIASYPRQNFRGQHQGGSNIGHGTQAEHIQLLTIGKGFCLFDYRPRCRGVARVLLAPCPAHLAVGACWMRDVHPPHGPEDLFIQTLALLHGRQVAGIVGVPLVEYEEVRIIEMGRTQACKLDGGVLYHPHYGIEVVHLVAGVGVEPNALLLAEQTRRKGRKEEKRGGD